MSEVENETETETTEQYESLPLWDNDFRRSPLTDLQIDTLLNPLHPSRVSQRSQGGRQLSFLEAHDVRATLIRLFGFGGFDIETLRCDVIDVRQQTDSTRFIVTVLAVVQIRIHQTGAVYSDVAAASQTGPVLGDVLDFAAKTAQSDAMKRCAVNLGTQFGNSLYNNGALADQVRIIVAPGQQRLPQPPAPDPATDEQIAQSLGGVRQ